MTGCQSAAVPEAPAGPGCRAAKGGVRGKGNHLLMGNTLLSVAQITLCTTAEGGGRRPGGDWRPEARQ